MKADNWWNKLSLCVCVFSKNIIAGGEGFQMNGGPPHDGSPGGGGGHAVGDELKMTGKWVYKWAQIHVHEHNVAINAVQFI